jgi:hypothetical protein
MDVDADGSDSDRLPAGTGAPANFKPPPVIVGKRKRKRPTRISPGLNSD